VCTEGWCGAQHQRELQAKGGCEPGGWITCDALDALVEVVPLGDVGPELQHRVRPAELHGAAGQTAFQGSHGCGECYTTHTPGVAGTLAPALVHAMDDGAGSTAPWSPIACASNGGCTV
jgi:hypothetical protein